MKELLGNNLPIKLYLKYIEDEAKQQVANMANFQHAFHHIAIMPDAHKGYGVCIGGVLATKDVIIPNAVGKDIGCGMCAVKTNLTEVTKENLKEIMQNIRNTIPVGFKHHEKMPDPKLEFMPDFLSSNKKEAEKTIVHKEFQSAKYQIGTLGGGNHFIEIQKGSDGFIWIMIHSGSRNIGSKVADYYDKLAKESKTKFNSTVPPSHELDFLPTNSKEGQAYIKEMQYCVDFALGNRKLMMERAKDAFKKVLTTSEIKFDTIINIAHNYARLEKHFNEWVWVHRKGATSANLGEIGIIPGSQGAKSYIVEGKGNVESFNSCSHGAGRKLSRAKARKTLNLEEEKEKLDKQGIIHAIRTEQDLDEAPGSYKDIDEVMEEQKDLIKILVTLTPLAVIKA